LTYPQIGINIYSTINHKSNK